MKNTNLHATLHESGDRRPPLPVTIAPGMIVVDAADALPATIVAFTEAYCIYRCGEANTLVVAPWRELALANICPAEPLLPANVRHNDERNLRAVILRELLALQEFGPTVAEAAALDELVQLFCGAASGTGVNLASGE